MRKISERHIAAYQRKPPSLRPVMIRTAIFGCLSVALYFTLYRFNESILFYSREGGWYFVIPIGIAFVFSLVHGNFTGQFWDVFGVKAKTTKK